MSKAEQKTTVEPQRMAHGARAWLSARLPLRLVIFVAYAAAGWGLLALLWFGLLN